MAKDQICIRLDEVHLDTMNHAPFYSIDHMAVRQDTNSVRRGRGEQGRSARDIWVQRSLVDNARPYGGGTGSR